MKALLAAAVLLLALSARAQRPAAPPPKDSITRHFLPLRDPTEMYVSDGNSDTLFYDALPPVTPLHGLLLLLPPTGQRVEDAIAANRRLLTLTREKGILVVVPSLNHNLYLDSATIRFLNAVLTDAARQYRTGSKPLALGGFSLGGMNAVRYAELAFEDSSLVAAKPVAVYGIDPPLDLERLYHSFVRTISKNYAEAAVAEASYYITRMNDEFGGSPETAGYSYAQHSMYSRSKPGGGNARFLRNTPVRIYSDPDIEWQLANRRVDFYDMNVLDGSAMINQLHLDGNDRATLITALGKGFRPDGTRHPHAWSLAEPEELVDWLLSCML